MLWFCGGHGACLTSANDGVLMKQRTLERLDRCVKGDLSVSTGPQFEWVDQRGQCFSSETYLVRQGPPIVASSSAGGVLPLLPFVGGSGTTAQGLGTRPHQGRCSGFRPARKQSTR
jgi:ABC-2 type transport system ATP-binding protein